MRRLLVISALAISALLDPNERATAQIIPQGAHVNLYFPQLANGGAPAQQWSIRFTFTNPDPSLIARVSLFFVRSSGDPLQLDFGSGPVDRIVIDIPPNGARILRSVPGDEVVVGWAQAFATAPVQATVAYRMSVFGTPQFEVNAEPTVPSRRYRYAANYFLGIALANVYEGTLTAQVVARHLNGSFAGRVLISVPGNGHTAFTLHERFSQLGTGFEGTVEITTTNPLVVPEFVAWGLHADSEGVISSLPSGRDKWPGAHFDAIWLAFIMTWNAAQGIDEVFTQPIELRIDGTREVNALAGNGEYIQINLALAELISDSPSELAFAIGHELGHIYQQRTGLLIFEQANREADADFWGTLISFAAGYDPYAAAGTLSKLAMATGTSSLVGQLFEDLEADVAHRSFSTRITTVFSQLVATCRVPEFLDLPARA